MDYWAIYRSDKPKRPCMFVKEKPTLNIAGMLEELNQIDPAICYRSEPRSFEQVEKEVAGN